MQEAIPGCLTRQTVIDTLLERICDGCDECVANETFDTIGETLVECTLEG